MACFSHRDPVRKQGAWLGGAQTSPSLTAYPLQTPVYGRGADLQQQAFGLHGQRQFLLALQHRHHLGQKGMQPLRTDTITDFPNLDQGADHLARVDFGPASLLALWFLDTVFQQADGMLAMIPGDGHKLVQNTCLLCLVGSPIARANGLQQLSFAVPRHCSLPPV